jgi:RNA polymerase sigma-70 factor, ECF subfamily
MRAQLRLDPSSLADGELARRCAERDSTAIRHVVSANNQRLFRAAWSILKDHGEAEEAVQAAYLKAFAGIAGFEGRSTLSTWLTRIVINEALARMRAIRRRNALLNAEGVSVIDTFREKLMRGSEPASPDAALAVARLRTLIERAVAGLPPSFRTVFVLRDVEGLSVEETAEATGLPAATVKTRLFRARRKLQGALAPDVRTALEGAFPFAGADCERMTQRVLDALQIE